ncbi:MAG TPA: hypothetical protein VMI34_14325 [Candidatus Bathyarchaeia archaeon]|nr:hypothetical protein [Candidatus Bathyarchaeia archaeon]
MRLGEPVDHGAVVVIHRGEERVQAPETPESHDASGDGDEGQEPDAQEEPGADREMTQAPADSEAASATRTIRLMFPAQTAENIV